MSSVSKSISFPSSVKIDLPSSSSSIGAFNPEHTITFNEVSHILKTSYNFDETAHSTALDILALYLKGQKIIYTESKTLCEKRLNTLMLPAIFIAAVCSILNFILKDVSYGTILISGLNAFNSFLLSLISYLKLDAKAESHKNSAYKFQKLESMCEFNSGKSLFFRDSVDVCEIVKHIEDQVMEIRETNQFIVPEPVRVRYPKICDTNVFTLVKTIQNDEIIVINQLKTAVQKLHCEIHRRRALEESMERLINSSEASKSSDESDDVDGVDGVDGVEEKESVSDPSHHSDTIDHIRMELERCRLQINVFDAEKNQAFERAVKHRERYLHLSETFQEEIHAETDRRMDRWLLCNPCDWCKT